MGSRGHHHDLQRLFDALNAVYFDGAVAGVTIGWAPARALRAAARRTFAHGRYYPDTRHIAIHPVLDNKWVPQYFVTSVIFHEMLHAVYPPEKVDGVQVWHTQSFLEAELRFVHRERAAAWELRNAARLHKAECKPRPRQEADDDEA